MEYSFFRRIKEAFLKDSEELKRLINTPCSQGLFLNEKKGKREDILKLIDFPLKESPYTDASLYYEKENIGKTKVYDLGLIYPQEIAASIPSRILNTEGVQIVLDLCSAPGGKTINYLNRVCDDVLMIANEIEYKRAGALASNLERLGFSNVIITSKNTNEIKEDFYNGIDAIILDGPCSGEGMIRKYPEIIDTLTDDLVALCVSRQKEILENAYACLKEDGYLIYSTCTYALEEDEYLVRDFLAEHEDMELIPIEGYPASKIDPRMVKFSPLNDTEGQFIAYLHKKGNGAKRSLTYKKTIKNKLVEDFIASQIDLKDYYLYEQNNKFYLSLIPLVEIKKNVVRYGIYIGEIIKGRFEPNHHFYRANVLKDHFKKIYDLNEEEYKQYIQGLELEVEGLENGYYLITVSGYSLGFGKCVNGRMKNKYPKGLRRVI